jgi:tRNA1Val (adenine37-N6)-methyltransferase
MANSFFKFKQFTIYHDKCGMKVGTDGVLLGAWANIKNVKKILDVGTGTGLIAIMLAQRTNAIIEAVELESNAFEQAKINISICPWNKRISLHNLSFQEYGFSCQILFDLIICNSPYFENSLKSAKKNRNIARHTDTLSHNDLLTGVFKLLSENGRFAVIMPYGEGNKFIAEASGVGLYCIKRTSVKATPSSSIKRLLLEFSKIPQKINDNLLIIGTDVINNYSDEYRQLSKEFYLAF